MKPIYFPFTYVDKPAAEALGTCFRQTVVYQPSQQDVPEDMKTWVDAGLLEIRVPVSGDEKNMAAALKEYRNWVALHQGGAIEYLKLIRDKIPFFDDTSISQIKANIQKKGSQKPEQKASEALFHARLFLQAAQEFDRQQNEISREMEMFEAMESDFIKHLTGENETFGAQVDETVGSVKEDLGLFMTAERLTAWNFLRKQDPMASGLYVTNSRSVFEELIDRLPDVRLAARFETIPVCEKKTEPFVNWQDNLLEFLVLLSNGRQVPVDGVKNPPMISGAEKVVALQIYIASGESFHDLFGVRIENGSFQTDFQVQEMKLKNIMFGMIE